MLAVYNRGGSADAHDVLWFGDPPHWCVRLVGGSSRVSVEWYGRHGGRGCRSFRPVDIDDQTGQYLMWFVVVVDSLPKMYTATATGDGEKDACANDHVREPVGIVVLIDDDEEDEDSPSSSGTSAGGVGDDSSSSSSSSSVPVMPVIDSGSISSSSSSSFPPDEVARRRYRRGEVHTLHGSPVHTQSTWRVMKHDLFVVRHLHSSPSTSLGQSS